MSIVEPRGTLNRGARSARQTPNTSLTKEQVKILVGRYETSRGIYFISPAVVNQATGRASEGYGTAPFSGQVFFNADPGSTGTMVRAILNGPYYYNIDFSLLKNIRLHERVRLQLRAEAFNLLNHANFDLNSIYQLQNINDANFGRSTVTAVAARVMQFGVRLEF